MAGPLPSLLLFARSPQAGRVKTRLAPALGTSGAALLYRAFLEDAARSYVGEGSWSPVLCADPGPEDPVLRSLFLPPWRAEGQGPGDLGTRLAAAFEGEFRRGAPAALAVGSDHPALPRRRLGELFERLASGRGAALIPAEDGGYCAIGLAAGTPVAEAFREVPWSLPSVLAVTLVRLSAAGVPTDVLAAAYDVDRPEDLPRLSADIAARDPSEPDYPRATAAALTALAKGGAA